MKKLLFYFRVSLDLVVLYIEWMLKNLNTNAKDSMLSTMKIFNLKKGEELTKEMLEKINGGTNYPVDLVGTSYFCGRCGRPKAICVCKKSYNNG